MIEYETKKPTFTAPRAAVYGFAKKYGVGGDEAERIYLKIGALATEEGFLAEAQLVSPGVRMQNDETIKL